MCHERLGGCHCGIWGYYAYRRDARASRRIEETRSLALRACVLAATAGAFTRANCGLGGGLGRHTRWRFAIVCSRRPRVHLRAIHAGSGVDCGDTLAGASCLYARDDRGCIYERFTQARGWIAETHSLALRACMIAATAGAFTSDSRRLASELGRHTRWRFVLVCSRRPRVHLRAIHAG
jgi:hypothetical protein